MAMAAALPRAGETVKPMTAGEKKVILASSLGTVFEWYDFFLYGSLATVIGAQFFSTISGSHAQHLRPSRLRRRLHRAPLRRLVFGRLGDLVGRKHTFLVTILIMGISTFAVGHLLPSYNTMNAYGIGWVAVSLLVLRMLQGLALGGEYGGAAVYVAEHAPAGRRGFYTSFIQATATLGLLLSLIIILSTQGYVNSAFPGHHRHER